MKRKEFLKLSAIAATLGPLNSIFSSGRSHLNLLSFLENDAKDSAQVSAFVQENFTILVQWLNRNGWTAYFLDNLGINLTLTGDELKAELLKDLDKNRLQKLMDLPDSGFDDFAGMNMIKPGFPAFSLLYHALASPRVRSSAILGYPELEHIDVLENYIYALAEWDHLKNIYDVNSNDDLVMAVFAYEYRPAFKTPHHNHADLVFSRTGVARIGQHDINFDRINRCFTNQPKDGIPVQKVAVVPARYGLFIAKRVKSNEIDLMSTGVYKPGDKFNDQHDDQRTFLQPIRKVFHNDLLFGEGRLSFHEEHKSEKLSKLAEHTDLKFYRDLKPTPRHSKDLIVQNPDSTHVISSFLVISQSKELIRIAKEGNRTLYFTVPAMIPGEDGYSPNRYFTSLNTQDVEDVELLEKVKGKNNYQKIPNKYDEPRTQPLFLNITHEQDTLIAAGYREVIKDDAFEKRINDGLYQSPLFEDSICEGKVTAQIPVDQTGALKGLYPECLSAYSIVTAPDFFPQVDNFDLLDFDVAPGKFFESNFYEGGVASLATARLTPNPKLINTTTLSDNQTYTAVLSQKSTSTMPAAENGQFRDPRLPKGYIVSGFLPDVASSVFAPGWDVTYSADKPGSTDVYLSTEGLGSPFVEDMKLCAASNGMWPASSPDSARTYQGALDRDYRNPTAIPLLDDELGFHKHSPAGVMMNKETFGWDGVQGPFMENIDGKWVINFADVGRADVVQNALDGNLDMSKLRNLTSAELISRMACLRKCIYYLPKSNFNTHQKDSKMPAFTRWWLISAEAVHFGEEDAKGWGIPSNLVGSDTKWVTDKSNAKVNGIGYLYVMVDVDDNNVSWDGFGRRRIGVTKLYVCQVTNDQAGAPNLAMATIKEGKVKWKIV